MSVLIKGMEMPTSCLVCGFMINCDDCEGHECYCSVLDRSIGYMPYNVGSFRRMDIPVVPSDYRIDGCPLVPVPDHGRLIDGDYLKQTHCAECTLYPDKCLEKTADGCDWGSIMHLRMCPTIIPADKDGEMV